MSGDAAGAQQVAVASPCSSTERSRGDGYRWVVLGVAVNAQMTASVVSQGVYTLVPFWALAYQLSQSAAALTVTAMNLGQIILMMALGWAIDRFGERKVVALMMVLMSAAAFGAAVWSPTFPVLLGWLLLLGACYAAVQPGGTRAIVRWFPPQARGMAIGIRQAGLPLGTSIAAATLPVLAVRYGWTTAAILQGVVGIFGAALFGLLHRDDIGQQAPAGSANHPPKPARLLRSLVSDAALRPVLVVGMVMVAFQYTLSTHVLSFLSNGLKVDIVTAGFVFALAQGVGIAGRISLAWISDKLWPGRRLRSLCWTILVCAATLAILVALPETPSLWLLLFVFSMIGYFGIGWFPLWLVQVTDLAPKTAIASTTSFAMTLNLVAISVMPPIFGAIVDHWGYPAAWGVLMLALVLAAYRLGRMKGAMVRT